MFAIIGIGVVFAAVISGYLMEHGNLSVLVQPAELVIIFGAATGALIISSPARILPLIVKNIGKVFSAKSRSKAEYIEVLALLNTIFTKMRKEGLIAIEGDIENPETSPIFSKYPGILKDHHALNFICDNLKVIISTNVTSYELENIMELEMETHHKEALIPASSVTRVADGLPGLGIVAAVLGVVLTMGKISEPPEVLGHSIGAALVGTFLGVLMCYGFVGPMGTSLEHTANEESVYYQVMKIALVSFVGGAAPQIAVEFARRAIPGDGKPTFSELEQELRK
ncbi:MAG: flagellar motor stator protein MotA [Nitrospirae bacterium]|nr:flagellar motor stator protein MotA [Nitrospirota bacterium]